MIHKVITIQNKQSDIVIDDLDLDELIITKDEEPIKEQETPQEVLQEPIQVYDDVKVVDRRKK